jgi:hypothetical protein
VNEGANIPSRGQISPLGPSSPLGLKFAPGATGEINNGPLCCHMVGIHMFFQSKIQIWVNFGRPCNRRCWYCLWPICIFYSQMVYFMAIRYNLWSFGIFFPVWVCCTEKNLATLRRTTTKHVRADCFRNMRSIERNADRVPSAELPSLNSSDRRRSSRTLSRGWMLQSYHWAMWMAIRATGWFFEKVAQIRAQPIVVKLLLVSQFLWKT